MLLALAAIACTRTGDRSPGTAASDPAVIRTDDGGPTARPSNAVTPRGNDMGDPVAFIDQDGQLSLTLWGSSSCPPVVTAVEVVNAHAIRAIVRGTEDRTCTADYGPTTSVLRLDRVDVTSDLRVDVIQPFGDLTFVVQPRS